MLKVVLGTKVELAMLKGLLELVVAATVVLAMKFFTSVALAVGSNVLAAVASTGKLLGYSPY